MATSNSSAGPSLPQAGDATTKSKSDSTSTSDSHSYFHAHSHKRFTNNHLRHSHERSHSRRQVDADVQPDAQPELDARTDATTASLITQIIQTVSLIQVVDSIGSPIEIQTRYAPPATQVVDSASGQTIAISAPDSSAASAAPASNPAASDNAVIPSSAAAAVPTLLSSSAVLSPSPYPVSSSALSPDSASQASPLTSLPLTTSASPYPTLGGMHNATTSVLPSGNTSLSETQSSTSLKAFDFSTPITLSFTSPSFSDSSTSSSYSLSASASSSISSPSSYSSASSTYFSSLSDTIFSTASSDTASATANDGGNGGNGGFGTIVDGNLPSATSTSTPSTSNNAVLSPQEKSIIGGVVGGVAGCAFILLLAMLVLRYKKRIANRGLLGHGQPASGSRGMITDGGPGSGGGNGGDDMTERSAPFAVSAALASLTGKRNTPTADSSEGGERGFYRVSGRKLPSVLQAGGDGYSDPRGSIMSGTSDYYRGSQAFDPDGETKLALGSPMRPVSGIPIIRTGPARTPMTEQNPFGDPPPRPRPDSDALGRSLASQDGSRGSGSRFHERI